MEIPPISPLLLETIILGTGQIIQWIWNFMKEKVIVSDNKHYSMQPAMIYK